jgi:hypothetical protein
LFVRFPDFIAGGDADSRWAGLIVCGFDRLNQIKRHLVLLSFAYSNPRSLIVHSLKQDRRRILVKKIPMDGISGAFYHRPILFLLFAEQEIFDVVARKALIPMRIDKRESIIANHRIVKQMYATINERSLPRPQAPD